jgi:microcystin-dependent protein
MSEPFIAEIRIFAGNFAPRGWSFCDGQLLPVAQNTALFSLIGTTYGGDGRTTTGLPDLQGRAAMHPGRGPGLTSYRLGQKVGSETAAAELPAHSHGGQGTNAAAQQSNPSGLGLARAPDEDAYATPGTVVAMAAPAVAESGSAAAHDNMQPYLALNFIIALTGVFPSRS